MPGGIRRADIEDADIVDAIELAATGLVDFVSGIAVTSTSAATKRVVFTDADIIHDKDYLIEAGDFVTLTGTAAGKYTVAAIVDEHTLTVVEAIVDSVGGTAAFCYAPGAGQVGVDPTNLTISDGDRVQAVLEDFDYAISHGVMFDVDNCILDVAGGLVYANDELVVTRT
jgi:hypothetical protein